MSASSNRSTGLDGWMSAFILALIGGLAGTVPLGPPESARPGAKTPPEAVPVTTASTGVLARTWEDPLGAVWARIAKKDAKPETPKAEPSGSWKWASAGAPDPLEQRTSQSPLDDRVTVIAVQMSDALTVEGEEDRMNCRIAAVAALDRLGFAQTSGAIGHIAYLRPLAPDRLTGLDSVIAYEWWTRRPGALGLGGELSPLPRACLVMYLTPGAMSSGDSAWFEVPDPPMGLVESAGGLCRRAAKRSAKDSTQIDVLVMRRASDALRADIEEWNRLCADHPNADTSHESLLPNLTCINFSATSDNAILFEDDPPVNIHRDMAWEPRVQEWIRRGGIAPARPIVNGDFSRVVGSDTKLLALLIKELHLRHIDPHDSDNAIAVICERDTAFGRIWSRCVREALRNDPLKAKQTVRDAPQKETPGSQDPPCQDADRTTRTVPEEFENIINITFLRAIDGNTLSAPRQSRDDKQTDATRSASAARSEGGEAIFSTGQAQFDYVLRSLRQCQTRLDPSGDRKLRAVLIGASDQWDAIPLVQLIRQNFPDVLILTTGLYAQYQDLSQYSLMRNVVVGSGLGLCTHSALQGNIPAFRCPYQTGLFVGVLQGLARRDPQGVARVICGSSLPADKDPPQLLVRLLKSEIIPEGRLYEISRDGAINLSPLTDENAPLPCDGLFYQQVYRPALLAFGSTLGGRTILLGTGLASFMLFVIALYIRPVEGHLESDRMRIRVRGAYAATVAIFGLLIVFLLSSQTLEQAFHLVLYMLLTFSASMAVLCVVWTWLSRDGLDYRDLNLALPAHPNDRLRASHSLHQWAFRTMGGAWTLICICIFVVSEGSKRDGEPFFWFSGISAWSTELIRIVIVLFSVIFFYQYRQLILLSSNRAGVPSLRTRMGWLRVWAVLTKDFSVICWTIPTTANGVDALKLREDLDDRLHFVSVLKRVGLLAVPFAVGAIVAYHFLSPVRHNVRGQAAGVIDAILTIGVLVAINTVVLYVWDVSRVHTRYILNLAEERSDWGEDELKGAEARTNIPMDLVGSLLDVEDIAKRSRAVNALIYWPVALILLSVLSLHPVFDRWPSGTALNISLALSLSLAVFAGFRLRRAAEFAREREIERLESEVFRATSPSHPAPDRARQAELLIKKITDLKEGAFAPWSEDPLFRAVALPLIGFATVHAADWASRLLSR
jgi:hypothetical protein